jgi:hypothetical protein
MSQDHARSPSSPPPVSSPPEARSQESDLGPRCGAAPTWAPRAAPAGGTTCGVPTAILCGFEDAPPWAAHAASRLRVPLPAQRTGGPARRAVVAALGALARSVEEEQAERLPAAVEALRPAGPDRHSVQGRAEVEGPARHPGPAAAAAEPRAEAEADRRPDRRSPVGRRSRARPGGRRAPRARRPPRPGPPRPGRPFRRRHAPRPAGRASRNRSRGERASPSTRLRSRSTPSSPPLARSPRTRRSR